MKVSELLEALQAAAPDADVFVWLTPDGERIKLHSIDTFQEENFVDLTTV